jgi:hypothetical protein
MNAIRDRRIETVRLIGPGSVSYTGAGEPIRFGCALIAHAVVMFALSGASVMLLAEVQTAEWLAAGGITLASIGMLARRRLDALRARDLLGGAAPRDVLDRSPGASATRVVRAALEAVAADAAGYRDRGGRGRDAIAVALEQALSAERRRRLLPIVVAALGAIVTSGALAFGPRAAMTWVYVATGAAFALHTIVFERLRRRELERALPALVERLSHAETNG